jgi:hypothetical protein
VNREAEPYVDQAAHYFARIVHAAPRTEGVPLYILRSKSGVYRPIFVKALARAVVLRLVELLGERAYVGAETPNAATGSARGNSKWAAQIRAEIAKG